MSLDVDESCKITLRAKFALPVMPNFISVENIRHPTLDQAMAYGTERMVVDVADLDDKAVEDFCHAWTLAFTRHVVARKNGREPKT